MRETLRHRGPDDAGIAHFDRAGMAFRRLALLDLQGGHQPAANEQQTLWSVFNGEIYNHVELREELQARGHVLRTRSDSELIPHLYEEWGPAFLNRLRGMFALAIYDTHTAELFLARDPFGIKPLYYLETGDHLLYASEARTILAAGVASPPLDPEAVGHYLRFGYVPDPLTMWRGLRKVPPGHFLLVRDGVPQQTTYWVPEFDPQEGGQLDEVADAVEAALRGSVAAHLVADVPVGAYLSSGVDSSVLVALASQMQEINTFSVGFEGARSGHDELSDARRLAARLGTKHHEERISAEAYRNALPQIVAAQEDPLADPSAPALWFLARAASGQVKAVLSGEGADELFAGYPIYREPHSLRAVTRLPRIVRQGLRATASRLPDGMKGKGFVERGTTPLQARFLGNAPIFDDATTAALLGSTVDGLPGASSELIRPYYDATEGLDDVVRMQTLSCQTWLPSSILMKADKMAMAHSLEVRVPFLDRDVFRVAAGVPLRYRVTSRTTKLALRAAASRVLPTAVAERPKLGFPVPFRSWLDEGMSSLVRELVVSTNDPLLDRRALESVLTEGRRPDHHRRVWALLVYLLWRDAFVPGSGAPVGVGTRGQSSCETLS